MMRKISKKNLIDSNFQTLPFAREIRVIGGIVRPLVGPSVRPSVMISSNFMKRQGLQTLNERFSRKFSKV